MPPLINKKIIQKFDVPGPRYTSYPTAPAWENKVGENAYQDKLIQLGRTKKSLSLYIHIPFCQSMCTFCACSVVIRKHESKYGDEYVDYLLKEIELITRELASKMKIKQFHWGGGTPNFLNDEQIKRLFNAIEQEFDLDHSGEIAIEIDPRTIDKERIIFLRKLGFNRISIGVQDFSEEVQKDINRVQPYKLVKDIYDVCRSLKFESINFDLIYGLPNQTQNSFMDTIEKVSSLAPDRIALYSFAYVPWLKKHQNKIDERTLPSSDEKLELFLNSREILLNGGYEAIAMDHFALKDDELAKAFAKGELYRNFMGYTVKEADEYIGIGMSSIGFLEKAFFQNERTLPSYYAAIDEGRLPVARGKILSRDDQIRQWTINCLMCQFQLDKGRFEKCFDLKFNDYYQSELDDIIKCQHDGLIEISDDDIKVTEMGKVFIRNICMQFDAYLREDISAGQFSKTV